jgi:hypothetical protein
MDAKTRANPEPNKTLALPLSPDPISAGIVSTGMYLPEPVLTASEIATQSDLPEWVVRDKLGIEQ